MTTTITTIFTRQQALERHLRRIQRRIEQLEARRERYALTSRPVFRHDMHTVFVTGRP